MAARKKPGASAADRQARMRADVERRERNLARVRAEANASKTSQILHRLKYRMSLGIKVFLVSTPGVAEPLGYVTGYDRRYALALAKKAKVPAPRITRLSAWRHIAAATPELPELVEGTREKGGALVPSVWWQYHRDVDYPTR